MKHNLSQYLEIYCVVSKLTIKSRDVENFFQKHLLLNSNCDKNPFKNKRVQ